MNIMRALRICGIVGLLLLLNVSLSNKLSMPGVRAQDCLVLSEIITESGDCVYGSLMIGCNCHFPAPCGEVHFCNITYCESGSSSSIYITITIYCPF